MINITIIFVSVNITLYAQGKLFEEPIKGVSFLGPKHPSLDIQMFESLKTTNSDWVALIPEAILDREQLTLKPDELNEHWANTIEAQIESIKMAKRTGLKVFLKPHVRLEDNSNIGAQLKYWLSIEEDKTGGAEWRGDFMPEHDKDWLVWEKSYEAYILKLASIAESLDVELFCIGTELRESVSRRPEFWEALISKVRNKYKGSITYSANWDEFMVVSFWDKLDYIGVNSYFPISTSKTPSIEETFENWKPIKDQLQQLHNLEGKKILITEYGYRNVSYAGEFPWEHDDGRAIANYDAQSNLYEAFYMSFWNEDWLAGGFCWNWLHTELAFNNTDFTVRKKPAFLILKKWYGQDR